MGPESRSEEQLLGPVSRRAVVAGAGAVAAAVALGACQTYGGRPAATTAPAAGGATGGGTAPLAKTSEIPVGGGKIIDAKEVVVTQAAAGTFAAFSTVCTHQGCNVNEIAGGTINCPCHGSKYNLDGTVANGPAPSPLPKKNITVQGDTITLA